MAGPFDPLPFLSSLDLFAGWAKDHGEAIVDLASRSEVWTFSQGDLVRFPDEAPGGPTWVAEGCLVVLEDKTPRYVGVKEPLDAPRGVWVRGQTAGRLVTVPEDSWRDWLAAWPRAGTLVGEPVPPPLPKALHRSPLVLEPGEVPLHLFRKAAPFLVLRAALPVGFFVLFFTFGLILQFGLQTTVSPWALWFLPGLGMAISGALTALVTWEWATSVLVITDRAVLVRQVDVWVHRSDFEKLALEKIREAVFTRTGWADSLLGLVALEIEGDSPKGRLQFQGLSRDSRFLAAMETLRVKRKASSPGRTVIRRALADRAGGARAPRLERPARRDSLGTKRIRRLSWRVEKNGAVWFRRHPWAVVKKSLPWFGWTALLVFLGVVAGVFWPTGGWTIAEVTFLLCLVPLGRIGWEIWDWADDRLSIQGEKILLVHRRPLWLGEVRQEGQLDQVQQVGIHKDSLAALVLDFGTLTVSLGASEPLIFEWTNHPELVQNEIFRRRTLLAEDREQVASQTRLHEVGEILDTWDEARKAGYFDDGKE